jgi:hypothetical protein
MTGFNIFIEILSHISISYNVHITGVALKKKINDILYIILFYHHISSAHVIQMVLFQYTLLISGHEIRVKKLLASAVPSVFSWTGGVTERCLARRRRVHDRDSRRTAMQSWTESESTESTLLLTSGADMIVSHVEEIVSQDVNTTQSQGVQTENTVMEDTSTQTKSSTIQRFSAADYKTNQRAMQFYTGLENYNVFMDVFISLGPAVSQLNYMYSVPSIKAEDQLFLTLVKLRTYKTNYELSLLFKITELEVYSAFVTWIRFMSLQWREINIWPEREVVHFHTPTDFQRKFPKTRAIFDGTECPVQKPKDPAAQQVTFSTYKNRNTAKVLLGVTPGGMVSYVSPAYGGSTSDRQIVERSNLTTMCDPTDSIMADKGFDVQDIFAPMDVTVNIPTFFKKRNRMTGGTVLKDRTIASKRVHVERVIGLGKTYKILCRPLNQTESVLSSDIIFVCYMLVNFRKCIVPRNA